MSRHVDDSYAIYVRCRWRFLELNWSVRGKMSKENDVSPTHVCDSSNFQCKKSWIQSSKQDISPLVTCSQSFATFFSTNNRVKSNIFRSRTLSHLKEIMKLIPVTNEYFIHWTVETDEMRIVQLSQYEILLLPTHRLAFYRFFDNITSTTEQLASDDVNNDTKRQ